MLRVYDARKSVLKILSDLAVAFSLAIPACAGTIGSAELSANAQLIDFDDLVGGSCNLCGTSVTNQYQGAGVTFNNPTYPGEATAEKNLTPFVPSASGNMLFIFQGGQLGQLPALPFQILFSTPVRAATFDFGSSANAYLELSAYDSQGTLIETDQYTGDPAPIGLAGLAGIQTASPISRLDVSYHLSGDPSRTLNLSIDNLRFDVAAPEPASMLMIASGLALAGILRFSRSRRRKLD
jgi:hypothetical protein